ncbi:ArsB/NhaD family transporter [Paenibacillus lautus]|uniref:ArsB/NhaD family transporter n=1 Tax=Paenibacillus lautus TaxID=1401 RepID=UPI002DB805C8|nr:ArsB/NhaD family transporter [Paenibacillus lautus]MEC0305975.1 ArsB/NhaD family transporter [Paenibacillus lautus]
MLSPAVITLTIAAFIIAMVLIIWRPNGLNEAIPASVGAAIVVLSGSVSLPDLLTIGSTLSSAAITIIATIVMAIILESFGFFNWAAEGLAARARGSGIRLFWYVNLLCFLMTLFFNNDGSILITTPILLILLKRLGLKNHEKIPYLLSGALIATASSAPIGVSNIVNLIALEIVDMDLYMHTMMMFVPATLGLLLLVFLLFLCFKHQLPRRLHVKKHLGEGKHPLSSSLKSPADVHKRNMFMRNVLLFVFTVRIALFVASYLGIPIEIVAILGSTILLSWRWAVLKIPPNDLLKKTPWHILVFAFAMYVLIYGLHNIGLTQLLIQFFEPIVATDLLNASLLMGGLLSLLSILFNNHPALMVGTITLTNMNLDPLTLKIAYLASVIGSDIGALLLPMGTLASLIWIHILKQHHVKIKWKDYIKVTILTIPPTLIFTLVILAFWVQWLY